MRNFQQIILDLQQFWADHNCVIMQPYDTEVGAGTLHPSTSLKALGPDPWNVAYVQPSRRPKDGRYGENPNRFGHYYQFQVILKPSPEDIQQLCLESLYHIGIEPNKHDIRFVEDDWENPTIGAWGLGWEVWCDGMEVLQFTYMQQIGGIECSPIPGELTYGLERLAMYIQNVDRLVDITWWNSKDNKEKITYGDIYLQAEKEFCAYSLEAADIPILLRQFEDNSTECKNLLAKKLTLPAYHHCLKTSHIFNLLDARGAISVTERAAYIAKVRNLAKECASSWVESQNA